MRKLFEAAAEEMGITLQRVAFSANIKARRDFSCALFDSTGELLAQAAHILIAVDAVKRAERTCQPVFRICQGHADTRAAIIESQNARTLRFRRGCRRRRAGHFD
ncbi:MAG: hypothetical protein PVS2B2_21010 [Candidatus Acidiferrum sp.]